MLGTAENAHTLGVIPCAISWLFRGINEQKQKTGARFSVRVSAVEVCGPSNQLKDLLAGHANGNYLQNDKWSNILNKCENPICMHKIKVNKKKWPHLNKPTLLCSSFLFRCNIGSRMHLVHEDKEHSILLLLFRQSVYVRHGILPRYFSPITYRRDSTYIPLVLVHVSYVLRLSACMTTSVLCFMHILLPNMQYEQRCSFSGWIYPRNLIFLHVYKWILCLCICT